MIIDNVFLLLPQECLLMMIYTSLKALAVGDTGKILGFDKTGKPYRKRLLAMGLTPGTEFKVTRFAPMGDPVEIKLRGFALTLRRDEAASLLIEKLP
jgi:ferrous iron transport protein A